MVDGLWTVEFISTLNYYGTGILVLSNNRLLGGDQGYYYNGDYQLTDGVISGNIDVVQYNRDIISVFGNIDHFSLTFRGELTEDNFIDGTAELVANPAMTIQIKCRKKIDLYENE